MFHLTNETRMTIVRITGSTNMVAKKTRVLLGMLSMDDFTIEELSRFSGVIPATVRSVVDRHRSLEVVRKDSTNRRGGQKIRYRLTSAGRDELTLTANATREAFASTPPTFMESVKAFLPLPESEIPLGLRLVDDTLNRLVPQAESDDDKLSLLEAAKREAQSALRASSEADKSTLLRIDKAVKEKLEKIESARVEIVRPPRIPAREPLILPVPLGIGIHVWSGVAMKSSLAKRVKKELQKSAQVIFSEVPADPAQTPEVVDAVILLVDSANSKKALSQFHHALTISSEVEKPMAVFDKGYNVDFRNHVYAAGVTHFCNDAATLNGMGMRGLIGDMLPAPASNALMVDAPKLSQTLMPAGMGFLKQAE
jgi:hypothetical protein